VGEFIALLRGINVGRAKRIKMADLRELVEGLGHQDVRTLLSSGNVIFRAARGRAGALAQAIQDSLAGELGIRANVIVITAADVAAVIRENPLPLLASRQPSRFLVGFLPRPALLAELEPLAGSAFADERFAVGRKAAYLFCANGVLESQLLMEFSRLTEGTATTRNWSTVLKLEAALSDI